jgi:hypothetical protein
MPRLLPDRPSCWASAVDWARLGQESGQTVDLAPGCGTGLAAITVAKVVEMLGFRSRPSVCARRREKLTELLPSEDSRGESGRFAAPQRHDVIRIARGNGLKSGANCRGQGIPSERLLE